MMVDNGDHAAVTLSRERTPERPRRQRKVVTSGIEWKSPEAVPGAVLSAEAQRQMAEHAAAWRAHHARARVSGRSYVIDR